MPLENRTHVRRAGSRWPVLGLALALVPAAAGAAPAAPKGSGAFDVILDDSHQCRVTLRATSAGADFALAMPPGCRRALPALDAVAGWSEGGEGQVRLDDASGAPVMMFEPAAGGLAGTSPEGETYRLRPVDAASRAVLQQVATVAPASSKPAAVKSIAAKRPAPKEAEVAGRYTVLRDKAKDTGCMVTLDGDAHGSSGTFKAHLAPACRDEGIVIFDPVGWQIERGRLVLTARKGHTTHLDYQDDGSWLKDPKDGKPLSLKKM